MFNEVEDLFEASDALAALSELESNTDPAIIAQRASKRLEVRTAVRIQPANPSDRHRFAIEAWTVDISNGGCQLLASVPAMVGDFFWLTFVGDEVVIHPQLSRCLRCRYIQEETYELGFRFEHNIDISNSLSR